MTDQLLKQLQEYKKKKKKKNFLDPGAFSEMT